MGLRPTLGDDRFSWLPQPVSHREGDISLARGANPWNLPINSRGPHNGQPDPLFFDRTGCRFTWLCATVVLSQPTGEKLL